MLRVVVKATGLATRQRSLGMKPLAPARGRIVMRVIPTAQEAMALARVASISGIIRKMKSCFQTFNTRGEKTGSTQWTRPARFCGLLIAGAFVLLLIVVVVRFLSPSSPIPEPVTVQTAETQPRRVRQPPPVSDAETYYRTIIDNNLFRPLGWTPPRPIEPYRLLGTILPRSETHTPPKAIIQTTAGQKTYIVSTGDKLDASTRLVSIQGKSVRLSTNGKQRTLHLPSGF